MGSDGNDDGRTDGDDTDRDRTQTRWDVEEPDTVTSAIVRAVADREEVDPTDMAQPLADVLDPDSLASLLDSGPGRGDLTVSFRYRSYRVTVSDDGWVELGPGSQASTE